MKTYISMHLVASIDSCMVKLLKTYFLIIFFLLKYVDFSIGDDSGYLRFEDSKAAEKARMVSVLADEGGLIIKDHIITLEPVTGKNSIFLLSLIDFLKLKLGYIIEKTVSYISVSTGEAEKDYWSRIRGLQENHKDNRSYKGKYYFVLGWLCFILPLYVLFCSALSQEVNKK
ncbi:hypothetical protein HU200_062287 [Digitaria exilis]|uniref:XRRM domain-containing protein n=1 Tax=Digitaria exilis TaxID=1010633 RepID=A0A835A677_9POAL|nr:hypothetical protein HU200_062287 [Digitaria exilis]